MLGVAGMHIAANELHACHGGIEVFIFEFAHFAAVHGVGPVGTEMLHIEFMSALPYLLVGG